MVLSPEPGDYNSITVGMVWARATGGEPFGGGLLRLVGDKAQALFDNFFECLGPDAPDVTIQELENELILYLTNDNPLSNNYREEYMAMDLHPQWKTERCLRTKSAVTSSKALGAVGDNREPL